MKNEFKVEKIKLKKGNATSVAIFNDGYSHIIVDDNCWLIVNGDGISSWIFDEAMEVLKQLPNKPSNYKPYMNYITGR